MSKFDACQPSIFFGERIRVGAIELSGEVVSFALVVVGAVILSHSPVVAPATQPKISEASQ
jgi:hypothetical protein